MAFGRNAAVCGEPNKAEEGELSSSDKGHSAPSGTVCCPRHETSKNRQSGSLPLSVHALGHSSSGSFTISNCRAARASTYGRGIDPLAGRSIVSPSSPLAGVLKAAGLRKRQRGPFLEAIAAME